MTRLALIFLALCVAMPASAQDSRARDAQPDTLGSLHVATGLGAAPLVALDLGRADVRIRAGEPGTVRAWLRELPGGPSSRPVTLPLALIDEEEGRVRVVATPEGRSRGVGLTLEIPPGAVLQAVLIRGDISVHGASGTFDLSTSRGDVQLDDVAGSVLVDLRDGSVRASFRQLDPELPSAFATLNGNVDLALPADAAAELDIRCRGCTLQRVPLSAALRRASIPAADTADRILSVYGPLGGGGPALRVFTWNGEVSVSER